LINQFILACSFHKQQLLILGAPQAFEDSRQNRWLENEKEPQRITHPSAKNKKVKTKKEGLK